MHNKNGDKMKKKEKISKNYDINYTDPYSVILNNLSNPYGYNLKLNKKTNNQRYKINHF